MRLKLTCTILLIGTIFSCFSSISAEANLQSDLDTLIDIVVASDGSGDYLTVAEGINAVPNNSPTRTVLFIKNGIYREKLFVPASKINLTMVGEHVDSTIIIYDDHAGRIVDGVELNTFTSQTIEINPNDFWAINLTFSNDARPGGTGDGQNVAVSSYGKRQVYLHCRFISWQDTYYTGSDDRHYFKDCFFEGAVDYIFGHTTAIFDSCQIHTVRSSGYITAASTKENYDFGYVFFNCRLTAPLGTSNVWLGRPWKTYAQTVFFECIEYENIMPSGWKTWDGRENTCFYAEYNCSGPGSDTTNRVDWGHQLSSSEASRYTLEKIFSKETSSAFGTDWNPAVDADPVYEIVREHTVMFMDSSNLNANIASLKINGEDLPDWNQENYEYIVEMASGSTDIPTLEASAFHPNSSVEITKPESLPGFAGITILANDRASYKSYSIYFSVDSSAYNTALDSILIAGGKLENFDPEVLHYSIVLPTGTSKYFPVTAFAQSRDTKVTVTKPASYPGTVTINSSAVDGSERSYLVEVSIATGLEIIKKPEAKVVFMNPFSNEIRFNISNAEAGPVRLLIYSASGIRILDHMLGNNLGGNYQVQLPSGFPGGLYLYHLQFEESSLRGKIIKK